MPDSFGHLHDWLKTAREFRDKGCFLYLLIFYSQQDTDALLFFLLPVVAFFTCVILNRVIHPFLQESDIPADCRHRKLYSNLLSDFLLQHRRIWIISMLNRVLYDEQPFKHQIIPFSV